jgi:hypothetical protein
VQGKIPGNAGSIAERRAGPELRETVAPAKYFLPGLGFSHQQKTLQAVEGPGDGEHFL